MLTQSLKKTLVFLFKLTKQRICIKIISMKLMKEQVNILNNNLYPLKLIPVSKETIWGGDRLKKSYNKKADFENIAESWELCVRPKEMSMIANGECKGQSLGDYIKSNGTSVICENFNSDRFPLLIKFIDARDRLSIQVHPDDEYGLKNENEFGKTEMWYIVEADEGAQLVYGLKQGCTVEDFRKAVDAGETESMLNFVNIHAGETYFIPSGLVHAIGAGILIAEIQQNSDVTYRVYDYNRRQADGTLRQLHTEKALDVIKPLTSDEIEKIRFSKGNSGNDTLANCDYFKVKRLNIDGKTELSADKKTFQSLLCMSGNAKINFGGNDYEINKGDSYYIPAGMGAYSISGKAEIIVSEV